MGALLDTVGRWLDEEGFPYLILPDDVSLAIKFEGDNGSWHSIAFTSDERHEFVFYSVASQFVDEGYRLAVAEYLMRANFGLSIGNFEIDMDDGEVRFRTGIDVMDDRLSPALIKSLIYSNWVTMDRYLPGLIAVIQGQSTAAEAIQQSEQD